MSLAELATPRAPGQQPLDAKDTPNQVRLEVNRTGLWTAVVQFSWHDDIAEFAVREAVQLLAEVDREAVFRIVQMGPHRQVLLNYSRLHG